MPGPGDDHFFAVVDDGVEGLGVAATGLTSALHGAVTQPRSGRRVKLSRCFHSSLRLPPSSSVQPSRIAASIVACSRTRYGLKVSDDRPADPAVQLWNRRPSRKEIDTATGKVNGVRCRIGAGCQVEEMAALPDSSRVYLSGFGFAFDPPAPIFFYVVDTATLQVIAAPKMTTVGPMAASPTGKFLYISTILYLLGPTLLFTKI